MGGFLWGFAGTFDDSTALYPTRGVAGATSLKFIEDLLKHGWAKVWCICGLGMPCFSRGKCGKPHLKAIKFGD